MIQQATPINWKYWKHMPEVKQWEACALSLGINPDRLKPHPGGWMNGPGAPIFTDSGFPNKSVKDDFNNRTRLLEACVFKSPCFKSVNGLTIGARYKATITLSEFVDWCASVDLDIPAELASLWKSEDAQKRQELPQVVAPFTQVEMVSVSSSAHKIKNRSYILRTEIELAKNRSLNPSDVT